MKDSPIVVAGLLRLYCIKIGILTVFVSAPVLAQGVTPEVNLARGILTELNLLRQNPRRYGAQLNAWTSYYQGKRWQPPGQPSQRTREGVKGLREAQAWLNQVQPLGILRRVGGIDQVALRLIPQKITATQLAVELNTQGHWEGHASFCRSQGFTHARSIVVSWLIDDGQKHRPNRVNLLNPLFRVVGVACVPQPQMVCVVTFAGGYHAKSATPRANPPRPSSPQPP